MIKSNNQSAPYIPKRFHEHLQGKEGQIIQAAFDCIVERGVAATSTHAIAARGGMSQGSIHYYFKNKDDLLLRLLEILFQNFIENIETIAKSPLNYIKKLENLLVSGFTVIDARREEYIVMIAFWAHAISVGGDMLRLYKKFFLRFRDVVIKTLEQGEGIVGKDAELRRIVAMLVVASTQGLGLQFVLDPKGPNIKKMEAFLKTLLGYAIHAGADWNTVLASSREELGNK